MRHRIAFGLLTGLALALPAGADEVILVKDAALKVPGGRLGGQITLSEAVSAFVLGSYEDRDYGGPVPGFIDKRSDQQTDFRLGVTYKPAKLWTITPQVAYTDNKSNVPFTDFDRAQALITVRRDFR